MKGYIQNIEGLAVKNEDFRQVLYTAKNCQLVVMALKPKEEIGPPNHRDGVVHHTRADAEKDTEDFDGKTTRSDRTGCWRGRVSQGALTLKMS